MLLHRKPLHFHCNTLDLKLDTFRANQKQLTRAEKKLTPERAVDDNNNSAKSVWPNSVTESSVPYPNYKQISNSISDYGVVYFRSDSSDLLLKRASTYSDQSYTFDNPAFINGSHDELSTCVMLSQTADRIKPYRPSISNYANISRSLDSIQDCAHDSAVMTGSAVTLPGTVMSQSEETINETCTVRNIVLDECSQAWDSGWDDDDVTIPENKTQNTSENLQVRHNYRFLL